MNRAKHARLNVVDLIWAGLLIVGGLMLFIDKPKAAFDSVALSGIIFLLRRLAVDRVLVIWFVLIASLQVAGEAGGWYSSWPLFDKLTHLLFPLVGSLALYATLVYFKIAPRYGELTNKRRTTLLFLFIFMLGVGGEVFWEIAEFSSDTFHWLPTTLQHGNTDTMVDIITSTTGAAIGGLIGALSTVGRYGKRS